jgi:hypothetical protein|tara:strand:+ start:2866 stop:3003 length:138 start_codon:yes stop_codon:yes gene_type:complete
MPVIQRLNSALMLTLTANAVNITALFLTGLNVWTDRIIDPQRKDD